MNIELLTRIAQALEATPVTGARVPGTDVGFNMRMFKARGLPGECGTTCCIGGLAALMAGVDLLPDPVAKVLGLTLEQSDALFYGHNQSDRTVKVDALSLIDPKHAASVVRNLIATGEVVWVKNDPNETLKELRRLSALIRANDGDDPHQCAQWADEMAKRFKTLDHLMSCALIPSDWR